MDAAQHLGRLRAGLRVLGIKPPSINPLILREVLKRNRLDLARVRLMVWKEGSQAHVMATALPYKISDKSARACLIKTNRGAGSRLSEVKSLDYELFASAYSQARARGLDEAILLNAKGHIFEASRANIFWIKDSVLFTPPLSSGCLNGITRRQVMKQARHLKIRLKERNLTPQELKSADSVFLTNSLIGIKPIVIV